MRKLINTLTMTAAIFMLSTAVPAAIPASVPAAASSSSLVKPWTNGRLMVSANHRSCSLRTDSHSSFWEIRAGCCPNVSTVRKHSITFRNAVRQASTLSWYR